MFAACFGSQGHFSDKLFCEFDEHCLSFSCCADIEFFIFKYAVLTFVNYNPCSGTLTLGLNEWSTSVDVSAANFGELMLCIIHFNHISLFNYVLF